VVNRLVATTENIAMTTLRLTYEELAERIQQSPEEARILAQRQHWHIEHDSDGKARVIVEEADLVVRATGRPAEQPSVREQARPPDPPADNKLIIELLDHIRALERDLATRTEGHAQKMQEAVRLGAHAEGEAKALRDALADLSRRLDLATDELDSLHRRSGWLRWLLG